VSGAINVAGLTGQLSLDAQRHVRRELGWAQLHDGEVRQLPAEL
jgi:outer membrane PBP1 activator LpoA protein